MRARLATHAFFEVEMGITDYELHDSDPPDHRQLYRIDPLGSTKDYSQDGRWADN